MAIAAYDDVLKFWLEDATYSQWFARDDVFDASIRKRFSQTHAAAITAELWHWRRSPQGRLAEIIVIDQFSRNLHRNSAQAFAYDSMALALAQEAIENGDDEKLDKVQRRFLYMPFMHSESAIIHEVAMQLFTAIDDENTLKYEKLHKKIIDKFGRYPHRNAVLGRKSTKEEEAFLKEPNSSF
ncbi:MAG: DUF924 domain-containing protein [Alphaproteobacteria bacterium]|nr:DUF924 domain-containing protein [Alphaproteobacteria bacterium]